MSGGVAFEALFGGNLRKGECRLVVNVELKYMHGVKKLWPTLKLWIFPFYFDPILARKMAIPMGLKKIGRGNSWLA